MEAFLIFTSMWIGYLFGAFLSTLITICITQKFINGDDYLSTLSKYNILNKSFDVKKDDVTELRNYIEEYLKKNIVEYKIILKVMLLIEEYVSNVVSNNDSNKLIGECSILIKKDGINIYLLDNGKITDWSNSNNKVTGIEAYVFYNLIDTFEDKRYITTVSYNRTVFNVPFVID